MELFTIIGIVILGLAGITGLVLDCRFSALNGDRWHEADYTGPFRDRPDGW